MRFEINAIATDGQKAMVLFKGFKVGSEANNFTLTTGVYQRGSFPSDWTVVNGMQFSTKGHDNDLNSTVDCATVHGGGGWYRDCTMINFGGKWDSGSNNENQHIFWFSFRGKLRLKKLLFQIKPTYCC